MADLDAGDVGDSVERAGRAVERDAEIAGARLGPGEGNDAEGEGDDREKKRGARKSHHREATMVISSNVMTLNAAV